MTKLTASRQQSADSPSEHQLVLGVDGGGTKTVAWLARFLPREEPEVLGQGLAGSANLRAVGQATAEANLDAAIDAAWRDANLECQQVGRAVLALAGAGLPEVQDQISTWAEKRGLAKKLQVVHDANAVLKAGTLAGWGIALVSGTGSVAFGQNPQSITSVSGGWGYWFGDEGSAFSIGQAALRAAAQAADGRGPATQLLQSIKARLGIENPREMLSALSRAGDIRHAIAKLADLVSSAAEQQDAVACEIVDQSARELTALVKTVAKELSLGTEFPLALAGGVMCGSQIIRESFTQCLSDNDFSPTAVQLVPDPVTGCLKMACEDLAPSD